MIPDLKIDFKQDKLEEILKKMEVTVNIIQARNKKIVSGLEEIIGRYKHLDTNSMKERR